MSGFKNYYRNNIANALTLLNMAFGSLAIFATLNGKPGLTIFLITLAGIADRFDGLLARHFGTDSDLGKQLDSMADVISFGISPAIFTYFYEFHFLSGGLKIFLILVTSFYICCGAFRLARYNCTGTVDGNYFGVPITLCGVLLVLSMVFKKYLTYKFFAPFMILLGILMISKFKFKKI